MLFMSRILGFFMIGIPITEMLRLGILRSIDQMAGIFQSRLFTTSIPSCISLLARIVPPVP